MRWLVVLFIIFLFLIPISLFFQSRNRLLPKETVIVSVTPSSPSMHPSQGLDLSYIEITADKTATIAAVNKSDQAIGYFLVQQGIRPPGLPTATESPMEDIASYYIQQPANGTYTAKVTTKKPGEIIFYLYDHGANVSMQKFQQSSGVASYTIAFNKDGRSTVVKQ